MSDPEKAAAAAEAENKPEDDNDCEMAEDVSWNPLI